VGVSYERGTPVPAARGRIVRRGTRAGRPFCRFRVCVEGLGFRIQGLWFRVSGFGFQPQHFLTMSESRTAFFWDGILHPTTRRSTDLLLEGELATRGSARGPRPTGATPQETERYPPCKMRTDLPVACKMGSNLPVNCEMCISMPVACQMGEKIHLLLEGVLAAGRGARGVLDPRPQHCRVTSLIRNCLPPQEHRRALGMVSL